MLEDHLVREVGSLLGIAPEDLDPSEGLFQLGMDSISTVHLTRRLERALNHSMPTTLTFEYPSVQAMVDYLMDRLGLNAPAEDSAADLLTGAERPRDDGLDELSEDEVADLLADELAD